VIAPYAQEIRFSSDILAPRAMGRKSESGCEPFDRIAG
jgi:hypothetical protein